jgi:hypothetical protein
VGILTRSQIESIDDLTAKMVVVEVPEWGGSVYLRPMNVSELDDYSNAVVRAKEKGLSDFRSRLVAYCLCDEKGKRLFGDDEVELLASHNAVVVNRLYEACDALNDISPRKVEEVGGNSAAGQPASSDSGSPATSTEPSMRSAECQQPSSDSGGHTTNITSHSAESGSKSGGSSQH